MKYHIVLSVLIVIALAIIIGSGFDTRGDVTLGAFRESESGESVTVKVGVLSSMGSVRAAQETQDGERLYVRFYSAFGGYNGTLGAKDSFELTTPDECREIWFFRDGEEGASYDLVLRREDAGAAWERVD